MKSIRCLILVFAIAGWSGCDTVPATVPETTVTDFVNADAEKFATLDPATQAAIQCTRLRERLLPDGRLEVAANLQNHATEPLTLKVSCVFKDTAGISINEETPLKTITMAAGAIETVRFTATNPAAKQYTVRVKRAR
jgi:uncharacterized protein YcfL